MTSSIITLFGIITIITLSYRIYNFFHLYFIHKSTLPRYLHGKLNSYSLITGASDGIGLALATSLQKHGFNIILHGRNEKKLQGLATQMQNKFPELRTVISVGDSMDPVPAVEAISRVVEQVEKSGGKLTLLSLHPAVEMSAEKANAIMDLNAKFPMLLTRALLPRLITNQPSPILNNSSYAGEMGMAYISIYAASKAFNTTFSASLSAELNLMGADVEVLGNLIAAVKTPGNPDDETDFATLTPEVLAESTLARIGCGKRIVAGNAKHAFTTGLLQWLPEKVVESIMNKEMQRRHVRAKKGN
ncbi:NAD(P)-binding protein [Tothia fuscella]|uniref:NAD(P)-binding protein n=1 Tax=Tothia fuscella TaxID=1048955 RepID=A0A9P4NGN8_9PEZI|nr:NAD(P)-binding protein [Tothia fuscella]